MKKRMRITEEKSEQVRKYMSMWIDSEAWTDLEVVLNHNINLELAADMLLSTGCISSKNIKKFGANFYPEIAYECERTIEELGRRFKRKSAKQKDKERNQAFEDVLIIECFDCGHCSFVPDGNEEIYDDLKTLCNPCSSENISLKRGLK